MPVKYRTALDTIPLYTPGRTQAQVSGRRVVKLSSNELPYGPLPSVAAALHGAVGSANRYPDFHTLTLLDKLSERLGVGTDELAVDNGSGALLMNLALVTSAAGDEVVYGWRSFEGYPIAATVAGATPVPVPLDADHGYDLDAVAAAISPRTRLVVLCNPNNPTGTAIDAEALEQFLDRVPADVVVALDEAYREFAVAEGHPDGVEVMRRHRNVVALRTFSKAYGLAGLRVGYAVAHPDLISLLRKATVGFSVGVMGQVAAAASLDAGAELDDRITQILRERDRVQTALGTLGVPYVASHANFVFMPMADAPVRASAFEERGVILRAFGTDGLRMTLGLPEENDVFLAAAAEVLA